MSSCWLLECIALVSFIISFTVPTSTASSYSLDNSSSSSQGGPYQVVKFEHLNEPYSERIHGRLNIEVEEVTPSSIHIRWGLTNRTYEDGVMETTVFCELSNAKIVSDKLHTSTYSFRFEFLNSNTKYLVCVHLLEKSKSTNTSILHYSCEQFWTIPLLRVDSIIGVLLTAGYVLLMGALGYVTWYRRASRKKKSAEEEKFQIEDKDNIYHSLKSVDRGGFSKYSGDIGTDNDGLNGGAVYKAKSSRGDCTNVCVGFTAKEDEEVVEYNASRREISF